MYFIVTGQILIFTDKDREAEHDLARLGPLDHFGEQGLLSMNAGKRTASARASEPSKLIRISGELIKNMLAHESKLVSQLEKIGREQQEISREDRKVQLLLRLSRSRSSLFLKVPRYPHKFSSLLVGVDIKRQVLQLDEVMSEYRNPIRADDRVTVTGSIAGTPIVFKSKVLESKIVDGSICLTKWSTSSSARNFDRNWGPPVELKLQWSKRVRNIEEKSVMSLNVARPSDFVAVCRSIRVTALIMLSSC